MTDTPALDLDALADAIASRLRADAGRLLNIDDLAGRLGLSPRGVRGLVARGELPEGYLIGGVRRWAWDSVRQHLDARQRHKPRRRRRGQYDRLRNNGRAGDMG